GARMRARGRMHPLELGPLFLQLLEGLGAAHKGGIVQRDLKPGNIFPVRDRKAGPDFVKLVDFGVSKVNLGSPDSMSMTRSGSVIGTPYYMSPEQARGPQHTDNRSDV